MVFSSLLFLFRFFPLVLIIYYCIPRKFKNLVLFVMSLIFYGWGEPRYVFAMISSILLNYVFGRLIEHCKQKGLLTKTRIVLVVAIITNILVLGFFKYTDLLIEGFNDIAGGKLELLHIALPIGISFYTFQTMSYIIDVYHGVTKAQTNFITFGTYVALFPQLIAGPIVQYKTISKELDSRTENVDDFVNGIKYFMIGLGKKILLANSIGSIFHQIQNLPQSEMSLLTSWIGIFAFAFQIYFDFSGYSDMAIGLGCMFGFHFKENFNYPYISKNITEFFRRWHISLGTWFKEYVYIPLGGNRKGTGCLIRNILVVWLLTGLWHGAHINFLLWGLYYGILLVLEKTYLLKYLKKMPAIFQWFYMMLIVIVGWVIFAFENNIEGIRYLKTMFGLSGQALINRQAIYFLYTNLILFIILAVGSTPLPKKFIATIFKKFSRHQVWITISTNIFYAFILILCVAYLVNETYNPFLYFRF